MKQSSTRPAAVARSSEPAPYSLLVCTPERDAWSFPIVPGRGYTIGRNAASDIVLDYPWVSHTHAVISGADPPQILDLGSRSGTLVGTRRLEAGTLCALPVGSLVEIGSISLLVQRSEEVTRDVCWPRHTAGGPVPDSNVRVQHPLGAAAFVSRNREMRRLYAMLRQVAQSNVSVLILGETGVGKELFAQAIHQHSPRSANPIVILNCAAVPESLVESELFGYQRGAFSGASVPKPGLFESAHDSTFFLDEVGELPVTVQPKLLRVLETGDVQRLGALRSKRVNVRIVAATNVDVQAAIARGEFRADLFYRLNGITLSVPPLRERREDILELAEYFVERSGVPCAIDREREPLFTPEARSALFAYAWPGNVRELKAVVERAALLAGGGVIDAEHLLFDPPVIPSWPSHAKRLSMLPSANETLQSGPISSGPRSAGSSGGPPSNGPRSSGSQVSSLPPSNIPSSRWPSGEPGRLSSAAPPNDDLTFSSQELPTSVVRAELERRERRRIQEALDRTGGNQKNAAILLGMSRRTLLKRLDRYEMARPRKRRE
ncbi:MAG TPA: sigma 54-interacting transcriptional regulator [Polyangiaceae bacterium]|nr:sigma 54-interacting transcriptional regulator [Polyangiaceae bacterium]